MFKKKKFKKTIRKRKKSVRIKKRKSPVKARKNSHTFFILLIWIIYGALVCYLLFYTNLLSISKIEIKNAKPEEKLQIESIFKKYTDRVNSLKIKNSNFLLFNEEGFRDEISKLPTIKKISLKKVFPDSLKVEVERFDLLMVVCEREIKSQSCGLLDTETGKLEKTNIDLNSDLYKKNKVLYIVLEDKLSKREIVIFPDILEQIKFFYNNVTYSIDARISNKYYAKTIGVRDFYLLTDEGWELRVDFTQDMRKVLFRLRQLFDHIDEIQDRDKILFIDTRNGEKLIYKLRDSESKGKK